MEPGKANKLEHTYQVQLATGQSRPCDAAAIKTKARYAVDTRSRTLDWHLNNVILMYPKQNADA